jgi:diguanylate cyclase (GGDEF)-like protein
LAGDEALKMVANVLRANCRASSVAARYGGEEFVILVPEVDKGAAVVVADRIRSEISRSAVVDPRTGAARQITVSLGVATFPLDGLDGDVLLELADKALYSAKQAGRDRVCAAGAPEEAGAAKEAGAATEPKVS